jgi:hypothetical protein
MNKGMTSQKNQREYLKHLKNSGVIIGSFIIVSFTIVAVIDYLIL